MLEVYEARRKAFLMFDKYCRLRDVGFANLKAKRGQSIWTMRTTEAIKEYNHWKHHIKVLKLAQKKEL